MRATTILATLAILFGLSVAAPVDIQKRTNRYPWVIFPGDPEYSKSHDSLWSDGKYT